MNSIASAVFRVTLIAGIFSLCFWIPLFYTSKKDFNQVDQILKMRAGVLEGSISEEKLSSFMECINKPFTIPTILTFLGIAVLTLGGVFALLYL